MYNVEAVRRFISKNGIDKTVSLLTSPDLPNDIKNTLSHYGFFPGGFLNMSLIYSLANA